jgi:hypothetical protein
MKFKIATRTAPLWIGSGGSWPSKGADLNSPNTSLTRDLEAPHLPPSWMARSSPRRSSVAGLGVNKADQSLTGGEVGHIGADPLGKEG